jgi:hypothetical protein
MSALPAFSYRSDDLLAVHALAIDLAACQPAEAEAVLASYTDEIPEAALDLARKVALRRGRGHDVTTEAEALHDLAGDIRHARRLAAIDAALRHEDMVAATGALMHSYVLASVTPAQAAERRPRIVESFASYPEALRLVEAALDRRDRGLPADVELADLRRWGEELQHKTAAASKAARHSLGIIDGERRDRSLPRRPVGRLALVAGALTRGRRNRNRTEKGT